MNWFILFSIRTLMPSGGALKGIEETDYRGFLSNFRREAPLLMRIGFNASVLLFVFGPLITVYLPLPAFLLPGKLLERHTQRMCDHPIYVVRMSTYLVKMVAGICWGMDPEVRAALKTPPLEPDPGTWRGMS
ncbi:MAG: hypothetical protein VX938_13595 [Myxococcota bacterium]|nr:hypothetical protein [Myxococcota bacterium]